MSTPPTRSPINRLLLAVIVLITVVVSSLSMEARAAGRQDIDDEALADRPIASVTVDSRRPWQKSRTNERGLAPRSNAPHPPSEAARWLPRATLCGSVIHSPPPWMLSARISRSAHAVRVPMAAVEQCAHARHGTTATTDECAHEPRAAGG